MDALRRRDRPCDACRRRKIRCLYKSDQDSQCILCQSRSTDCTFLQDPPRKKRALSYSGRKSKNTTAQSPDSSTPIQDYSSLPGPTLLKRTLGHQNRQSSSYIGATSDNDPLIFDLHRFDRNEECRISGFPAVLRRVSENEHYFVKLDTPVEMEQELADLDEIESIVTPYGPALVKLYFRIVHPSFPIIHKKVFLEKSSRTYRELTPLGLAAVYLLALDWWSYSASLASLTKPNVEELETIVSKLMTTMVIRPKISDVQACLVIAQRLNGDSWGRTGTLVSMAQTLGVHLDSSNWSIPTWEKGVRKRIAWALYMQDKWGTLIYGRPSHITLDNWEVEPLDPSDFPETAQDDDDEEGSSEIEVGMQIFLAMNSLTEILADIIDNFFTLRILRTKLSIYEVLERAKPLQIRLKEWYSNLPTALSMGETKSRKLSSNGYLHLAYFVVEITLHRAIIRSHDVQSLDEELRAITRSAAKSRFVSAIDLVKRLRPEHLQSFWYFASKINLSIISTFGIVLCITSSTEAEREFYASQLAEYRWILRVSSTAAEFMKYTVTLLDLQQSLTSSALISTRSSSSPTGVVDQQSNHCAQTEMNSGQHLDWLQNLNQQFDISFDDLAGYSIEDFAAYR